MLTPPLGCPTLSAVLAALSPGFWIAPCACLVTMSPDSCSLPQLLHLLWRGSAKAPSHPHITSLRLGSPALLIPVPTSPSHPLVPGGARVPLSPVSQL